MGFKENSEKIITERLNKGKPKFKAVCFQVNDREQVAIKEFQTYILHLYNIFIEIDESYDFNTKRIFFLDAQKYFCQLLKISKTDELYKCFSIINSCSNKQHHRAEETDYSIEMIVKNYNVLIDKIIQTTGFKEFKNCKVSLNRKNNNGKKTIIVNQIQKVDKKCFICGKLSSDNMFECPKCGRIICLEHFDKQVNECDLCVNETNKINEACIFEENRTEEGIINAFNIYSELEQKSDINRLKNIYNIIQKCRNNKNDFESLKKLYSEYTKNNKFLDKDEKRIEEITSLLAENTDDSIIQFEYAKICLRNNDFENYLEYLILATNNGNSEAKQILFKKWEDNDSIYEKLDKYPAIQFDFIKKKFSKKNIKKYLEYLEPLTKKNFTPVRREYINIVLKEKTEESILKIYPLVKKWKLYGYEKSLSDIYLIISTYRENKNNLENTRKLYFEYKEINQYLNRDEEKIRELLSVLIKIDDDAQIHLDYANKCLFNNNKQDYFKHLFIAVRNDSEEAFEVLLTDISNDESIYNQLTEYPDIKLKIASYYLEKQSIKKYTSIIEELIEVRYDPAIHFHGKKYLEEIKTEESIIEAYNLYNKCFMKVERDDVQELRDIIINSKENTAEALLNLYKLYILKKLKRNDAREEEILLTLDSLNNLDGLCYLYEFYKKRNNNKKYQQYLFKAIKKGCAKAIEKCKIDKKLPKKNLLNVLVKAFNDYPEQLTKENIMFCGKLYIDIEKINVGFSEVKYNFYYGEYIIHPEKYENNYNIYLLNKHNKSALSWLELTVSNYKKYCENNPNVEKEDEYELLLAKRYLNCHLYDKARSIYESLCEKNDTARKKIAIMYKKGLGCEKNLERYKSEKKYLKNKKYLKHIEEIIIEKNQKLIEKT